MLSQTSNGMKELIDITTKTEQGPDIIKYLKTSTSKKQEHGLLHIGKIFEATQT